MKLFRWLKDGGPESRVWGFFLVEIKWLFSIVLLRFDDGSREAYHSHAFNSVSWLLKGHLVEHHRTQAKRTRRVVMTHLPSVVPILTRRITFHRVVSIGTSWVLSFRGPWAKEWHEFIPEGQRYLTLKSGRREMS